MSCLLVLWSWELGVGWDWEWVERDAACYMLLRALGGGVCMCAFRVRENGACEVAKQR